MDHLSSVYANLHLIMTRDVSLFTDAESAEFALMTELGRKGAKPSYKGLGIGITGASQEQHEV